MGRKRKVRKGKNSYREGEEDTSEEDCYEKVKKRREEIGKEMKKEIPENKPKFEPVENLECVIPRGAIIPILRQLDMADLLKMGCVSKSFYQLSKRKILWSEIKLDGYEELDDEKFKSFVAEYVRGNEFFHTFILNGCTNLTDLGLRFLAPCCSRLKTLEIGYAGAELSGKSLGLVLKQCQSTLESLKLTYSYSLFNGIIKAAGKDLRMEKMSRLVIVGVNSGMRLVKYLTDSSNKENIKELVVGDTKYTADFPKVLKGMLNLEIFRHFEEHAERKFECQPPFEDQIAILNQLPDGIKTLDAFLTRSFYFDQLVERFPLLENLSTTHQTGNYSLTKVKSKIKYLCIGYFQFNIPPNFVPFPNLEHLVLKYVSQLKIPIVGACSSSLKTLEMHVVSHLTGTESCLSSCTKLETLSLIGYGGSSFLQFVPSSLQKLVWKPFYQLELMSIAVELFNKHCRSLIHLEMEIQSGNFSTGENMNSNKFDLPLLETVLISSVNPFFDMMDAVKRLLGCANLKDITLETIKPIEEDVFKLCEEKGITLTLI